MKRIAIAQARMGSTRLPGKVMRELPDLASRNMPVLGWTIGALQAANCFDKVILATSTLPDDDPIALWAIKNNVDWFRGSESDVLDRYYQCAAARNADVIVRVTCDCPFHDAHVIAEVVKLQEMTNADLCSNVSPPTWPDGLDVECFTFRALHAAWSEATRPSDRDCLPQFIHRNRHRFPAVNLTCPLPNLDKERWVLDTQDDWEFCQKIAGITYPGASYLRILNHLKEYPSLREINNAKQGAGRDERFYQQITTEQLGTRSYNTSKQLFNKAIQRIPLAAQTFSKSHLQFPHNRSPLFVSHADGCRIFDVDGNDYIDMVNALLPVILGYRDPDVNGAIHRQLDSGISFSLATELEYNLAELLCRLIPCAEMVKLGKSGTDVTSAAVRLARAFTGRDYIVHSGYHGWADWSLSTGARSLGVPAAVRHRTHKIEAGEEIRPGLLSDVACVIVEPGYNAKWLRYLREECIKYGTLLIFDEIITGFRWDLGGAQKLLGVTPDLATFGKAMANGMPISALAGKREYMKRMEPPDNIFYSGTMFGETLSIAAAIATIEKLERENVVPKLLQVGAQLEHTLTKQMQHYGLTSVIEVDGFYPRLFINILNREYEGNIRTLFMSEMAQNGVLIINQNCLSYAHRPVEMQRVIKAYDTTFGKLAEAIATGKIADYEKTDLMWLR